MSPAVLQADIKSASSQLTILHEPRRRESTFERTPDWLPLPVRLYESFFLFFRHAAPLIPHRDFTQIANRKSQLDLYRLSSLFSPTASPPGT